MVVTLQQQLATSTRLRFRAFSLLVAVLFSLSFGALCIGLLTIVQHADGIETVWIGNTRLLGEMSNRLSELRLAQAGMLMATDAQSRQVAARAATGHRQVLVDLEKSFSTHEASRLLEQKRRTFTVVDTYLNAERQWESTLGDGKAARRAYEVGMRHRYEEADDAVDALVAANANAAGSVIARIGRTSGELLGSVLAIGLLVLLVQRWTMRRLDIKVFRPLERITDALGRLSSGQGDVEFPSLHRRDEIGGLSNAFQRFRRSAEALRMAYAATRQAEESAAQLARHDSLTGLFNRRHMTQRLDELASTVATSPARKHFLYVIDLDRFKPVNDLFGHAAGDIVLCAVARRLTSMVSEEDLVGRLGGDEFAVLASFKAAEAEGAAVSLAAQITESLRAPIAAGECLVEVAGSVGVAAFGRDGIDADSLIRSADVAMYRAKNNSAQGFQFFEESMREQLREEAAFELDVREAVSTRAIQPHYQPLIDLREERVYGFEILARWTHPQRGVVPPDAFIPVIERLGLATLFTLAMLRQACRDANGWPEPMRLALNISPRQLVDPLLPAQILTVLADENYPANRLEIEMTESALVGDIEAAKKTIDNFHREGVGISLDDFGTGYSGLHHLRALKFDKVKIDKSFIQSMMSNAESEKIVDAILNLSDGLGLSALAEGIETAELEHALRNKGCPYGQGFLFGKAVPAEAVAEVLQRFAREADVLDTSA